MNEHHVTEKTAKVLTDVGVRILIPLTFTRGEASALAVTIEMVLDRDLLEIPVEGKDLLKTAISILNMGLKLDELKYHLIESACTTEPK